MVHLSDSELKEQLGLDPDYQVDVDKINDCKTILTAILSVMLDIKISISGTDSSSN